MLRGVEGAAPYNWFMKIPFARIAETQPKAVSSRAQSRDLIDLSGAISGRSLGKLGMTSLSEVLRGVESPQLGPHFQEGAGTAQAVTGGVVRIYSPRP